MKAKKAAGKILAAALAVSMTAVPCQGLLAATTSNEVTDREKENAAIARSAAAQSMVLLENKNQALPLKGKTIGPGSEAAPPER